MYVPQQLETGPLGPCSTPQAVLENALPDCVTALGSLQAREAFRDPLLTKPLGGPFAGLTPDEPCCKQQCRDGFQD